MAKTIPLVVAVTTFGAATLAQASGVFLQEATYANLGTAGAGDGVYTEAATSIWTNPAVMSHMDQELTSLTGTLLNLDIEYNDSGDGQGGNANSTLPVVGFFHVIDLENRYKVGLAFGSIGGATLDYGDEWAGKDQLTDVALLTYQFNPSLSYSINEQWSIAGGVQINYAFLQGNTAALELDTATDWALGYNLGTVFQATDNWNIGLSYRSELNHEFESDLYVGTAQGHYQTHLPSPAVTDLSTSYAFSDRLTLLTSIQHHDWSTMTSTDIDITLPNNQGLYVIDRDWDDVWRLSVGGDYQLSSSWALKVGYAYETSPLDDPSKQSPDLPVGEQHRYSLGLSKQLSDSRIDFYYEFADFGEMEVDQQAQRQILSNKELHGYFSGYVHFIGASYTY